MVFRFRKSIKLAPGVKLNLNKKSTGITFGGKGFHYTVNSKGKRTASVGIPGTGLSYSTSSGGKSPKKKAENDFANETNGDETMKSKSKKKGCLPAIIISVVILGIIGSCGTDNEEVVTTTVLSTAAEELITEEVTTAPSTLTEALFSTTEAETTTEKISTTQEQTTEKETTTKKPTTTERETTTEKKTTTTKKATTQKAATTKKPTTTQRATTKKVVTTQKPTTTKKVTTTKKKVTTTKKKVVTTNKKVNSGATDARYILNTDSKKFHYPSCHSAAKIKPENYGEFDGTRDEIIARGYSPCGNCDP